MGYTHYWYRVKDLSEGWNEFVRDVKRVYKNLPKYSESAGGFYENEPIKICGGLGKGKPVFDKDEIWFNGDSKRDLDHETFWLVRNVDREVKKYEKYLIDEGFTNEDAREFATQRLTLKSDGYYFRFCKTARKPYDFFVCCVLILAKIHFGDKIRIRTDGGLENWAPVFYFMQKLGFKIPKNLFWSGEGGKD